MVEELCWEEANTKVRNEAGNSYSFFGDAFLALPSPFEGVEAGVLGELEAGGDDGVDAVESLLAALLYPSLR